MKHFGRLICRLEGNIKIYLKEVGLYGLIEDRVQWHAVVKTVINPFFIYLLGELLDQLCDCWLLRNDFAPLD
jgi:hypothetical protein